MAPSHSARILIVEDEAIVALEIRRLLEARGYEVVDACASGEEALVSANEHRPDLVLMDIRLQGALDGIETAIRLRELQATAVVFLTAHSEPSTLERAAGAGAYGYVVKPFQPQELAASVQIALAKRAMDLEVARLNAALAESLARVKLLSGLLPICASCKMIRDSKGEWQPVEVYIRAHSEANFSHGVCPTCTKKLFPDDA